MGIVNWKNIDEKWENQCVSVTNVYTLTSHPSYKEAKKNGSLDHAKEVVETIVKDREEYKRLADTKDAILVPVMGSDREKSKNQLPIAFAEKLREMSGMPIDMSFFNQNSQHNTDATWEDRVLNNKDQWQGNVQKGKRYILVDDVFTSGMTLNSLRNYIEDNGGKVIATTSLASSRYGKQLGVTEEQLEKIRRIDKEEQNGLLEYSYKKFKYKDGFEGMPYYEAKFQIESKKLRKTTVSFFGILEETLKQQIASLTKKADTPNIERNLDVQKLDLNGAVSIAKEKIQENESKLDIIFAKTAGKRNDLSSEVSQDSLSATIKIPWFINKDARDVLKDYANILGGTYTNIRIREEVDGKVNWKTAAQIEFKEGTSKIPPTFCAKIILGDSVDSIISAIGKGQETPKEDKKKVEFPSLTTFPDMDKLERMKEAYSNTIVMMQDREWLKVYGNDVSILEKLNMEEIQINKVLYPSSHPNAKTVDGKDNLLDVAVFPSSSSDKIFQKLIELNYRVALTDFIEYKQGEHNKKSNKKGVGI